MKGRIPARWLCAVLVHHWSVPIVSLRKVCWRCGAVINLTPSNNVDGGKA